MYLYIYLFFKFFLIQTKNNDLMWSYREHSVEPMWKSIFSNKLLKDHQWAKFLIWLSVFPGYSKKNHFPSAANVHELAKIHDTDRAPGFPQVIPAVDGTGK